MDDMLHHNPLISFLGGTSATYRHNVVNSETVQPLGENFSPVSKFGCGPNPSCISLVYFVMGTLTWKIQLRFEVFSQIFGS